MTPANPEVPFAFWLDPVSKVTVSYSLPVFHEIDFQVNEGHRRIPHGGVEVGGLLYGKVQPDSLSIEAFRNIACEHASGPSFNLSERDLEELTASILSAPRDEELQGLVPLGWFISHTRSALRMTERELELFGHFFPEPLRVTLLVKPERFKPTRFAFLLRDAAGRVDPEGERAAVILPLPGRPGKPSTAPIPAISAPEATPPLSQVTASPADAANSPAALDDKGSSLPASPIPVSQIPRPSSVEPLQSEVTQPTAVPPPSSLSRTGPMSLFGAPLAPLPQPEVQRGADRSSRSSPRTRPGRLLLILALAALLGCGAGYWAYLQLPPPIISLRVQKESNDLLILWDPAQTQSSRYAVIRVNDSPPTLLTEEQKASGIAQVPLAVDTVKVEIIAQHWTRESRGIVRFVAAPPASPELGTVVPPATNPVEQTDSTPPVR